MNGIDILCFIISLPFIAMGIQRTIWWIRFRRNARIIKGGIIVYKIEEGVE